MASELEQLVSSFESNPWAASKALRELVRTGGGTFSDRALALIKTSPDAPGSNYLLTLLSAEATFLNRLCDPAVVSSSEAGEIARRIQRLDSNFDVRVMRHIADGQWGGPSDGKSAERMLEMMSGFSEIGRVLPMLAKLLLHANPRIRSKAVLLAGRAGIGAKVAETCLCHEDNRVRANAVEALWHNPAKEVPAILLEAARDSDNRVAANAVLGLYKLDDTRSIALLGKMTQHESAAFRASAAWTVMATGDPRFLGMLGKMVSDRDAKVRHNVFRALTEIRRRKAVLCAAPALRVFLAESVNGAETERRLRIAVRTDSGKLVHRIAALQFVLTEGQEEVSEYSVQEMACPGSLTMGVAFPKADKPSQSYRPIYSASVQQCIPSTRQQDEWVAVEYDPVGMASGMVRLMTEMSKKKPDRHVVLVDAPQLESTFLGETDVDGLLARAKAAKIRIHGLIVPRDGAPADPQLDRLCHSSGGRIVSVEDGARIPGMIQDLFSSLLCSYEIAYVPQNPGSGPVSVQVYTAGACGGW